jgi:CubicO group peptidase (beta-lactamase class C family)
MDKGIFPGISILAGKGEEILFKKHYGCKSLLPRKEPLEDNTIYDVASLTKPLVTAFLTLYLVEKEKGITLSTGIKTFFPHLDFDIKLVHLLTHTSGLPAWYPFYLYGSEYLPHFESLKLKSRPGRRVIYSCVGYILLYYIIEKMAGTSFRSFAHEVIFEPLGLKNTFLTVPEQLKALVAPTEKGNRYERELAIKKHPEAAGRFQWRENIIRGETHDCNSRYLGGTAGNAGLFSTADDIFKLTREFYPAFSSILSSRSARHFWKNFTPFKVSHRAAGFKLNSSFITSGGRALSRKAAGHNGITGTSLWLEPFESKGGYTFILLTNRVHPVMVRESKVGFNGIRRKLHRLIIKEMKG